MIIEIILPVAINSSFTYKLPDSIDNIQVGDIVEVEFNNKNIYGLVIEISNKKESEYKFKIKPIIRKYGVILKVEMLRFIQFVAKYTVTTIGEILKMVIEKEGLRRIYQTEYVIIIREEEYYKNLLENSKSTKKKENIIRLFIQIISKKERR